MMFRYRTGEPLVEDRATGRLHRPTCWLVNGGRQHECSWIEEGEVFTVDDPHALIDSVCGRCVRVSRGDVFVQGEIVWDAS